MEEDAPVRQVRRLTAERQRRKKAEEKKEKGKRALELEKRDKRRAKRRRGELSGEDTPSEEEESADDDDDDEDMEGVDARLAPHLAPLPQANVPPMQEEAPEQLLPVQRERGGSSRSARPRSPIRSPSRGGLESPS